MNIKQDVTVLGITRYNFTNDAGELVKGTTVHFYDNVGTNEENRYGVLPQKSNLPYDAYDGLKSHIYPTKATAIVTVDLVKQKMKVTGLEFSGK